MIKIKCKKCDMQFIDYESNKRIFCSKICLDSYRKGKTFEEFYGKQRAILMKRNISLGMEGHKVSNETREIIRRKLSERGNPMNNKKTIEKMRKSKKGVTAKTKGKTFEEFYGKQRAIQIKEKIKKARANQKIPVKDSSIEVKIQNLLSILHIEFFTHKYISEINHSYQCDIFIPKQRGINKKTIIEADGCYFHGCPICKLKENEWTKERKKLDNLRTKELQEKGFRVIRLWEHNIKSIQLANFKEMIR